MDYSEYKEVSTASLNNSYIKMAFDYIKNNNSYLFKEYDYYFISNTENATSIVSISLVKSENVSLSSNKIYFTTTRSYSFYIYGGKIINQSINNAELKRYYSLNSDFYTNYDYLTGFDKFDNYYNDRDLNYLELYPIDSSGSSSGLTIDYQPYFLLVTCAILLVFFTLMFKRRR